MGFLILGRAGQLAQSLCDTTPVNSNPAFIGHDRHEFQRRGTIRWEAFTEKPKQ
jgi:hypothetical protein